MQTLDIQQDIQPIHYAKAGQSEKQDKCSSTGLVEDKNTFYEVIQNILAESNSDSGDSQLLSDDVKQVLLGEKNAETLSLRDKMHKKDASHKNSNRMSEEAQNPIDNEISVALCTTEANLGVPANDLEQYGRLHDKVGSPVEINAANENIYGHEENDALISESNFLTKKDKKRRSTLTNSLNEGKKDLVSDKSKKNFLDSGIEDYQNNIKHKTVKQTKPVVTVIDERSVGHFASVIADASVHEAGSAVTVENTKTADMVFDFHTLTENANLKTENGLLSKEASGASFSAILAERIQDMSNDFVQAGNIILKDNNAGIIRLHLQPAYLGSVRINLELGSDKKVLGKIIVGSKDTYDAFKESIETLAEAFETGGFSGAHFDVSWSGEAGSGMAQEDSDFNGSFAENSHLKVMQEKHYADTEITYAFENNQAINVLA